MDPRAALTRHWNSGPLAVVRFSWRAIPTCRMSIPNPIPILPPHTHIHPFPPSRCRSGTQPPGGGRGRGRNGWRIHPWAECNCLGVTVPWGDVCKASLCVDEEVGEWERNRGSWKAASYPPPDNFTRIPLLCPPWSSSTKVSHTTRRRRGGEWGRCDRGRLGCGVEG